VTKIWEELTIRVKKYDLTLIVNSQFGFRNREFVELFLLYNVSYAINIHVYKIELEGILIAGRKSEFKFDGRTGWGSSCLYFQLLRRWRQVNCKVEAQVKLVRACLKTKKQNKQANKSAKVMVQVIEH
jgi:hypothetical protein